MGWDSPVADPLARIGIKRGQRQRLDRREVRSLGGGIIEEMH